MVVVLSHLHLHSSLQSSSKLVWRPDYLYLIGTITIEQLQALHSVQCKNCNCRLLVSCPTRLSYLSYFNIPRTKKCSMQCASRLSSNSSVTSWQHLNLATPLCQVHQQDNGCSKRFSGSHSCFMPSPNESLELRNLIYLPSCKSQTEVSEKMFLRYRMNLGRYEHETKKSNKSFPDKRDESHQYFMP